MAARDLLRGRAFQEQVDGFAEVVQGLADIIALAGDVQLRAAGHKSIALPLQQRRPRQPLHGRRLPGNRT